MHDRLLLRRSLRFFRDFPRALSLSDIETSDVGFFAPKPRSASVNEVDGAHVAHREALVKYPKQRKRGRKDQFDHEHREEVDGRGLPQMSSQKS